MLLMVATSCHHGLLALSDSKDGLQGALFNLWTPDAKHHHHQPNTTHLDPNHPLEALAVVRDLSTHRALGVVGGKGGDGERGVVGGGCGPGPLR